MTKTISIFFLLFVGQISLHAQDFSVNENGKYTFSEVVELPGMSSEKLFNNGMAFMKKVKVLNSKTKYLSVSNDKTSLSNKGSFYVYKAGSLKKAIAGAVEYDLILEFKEGKYRYTLTNYIFNEYKKNRFAKYEPVKGKHTPLEMEASSLNKKEWEKQRATVYDKSQELISNLYEEMIYSKKDKSKKNKKVKKEENW